MPNTGALSFRLALTAMVLGMSASSAHAYLDPGTGSIVLQLLLGGVAGIALVGRLYWHRFLAFTGLKKEMTESLPISDQRSGDANERSRR